MYDVLIVGAGMSGCVMARLCAEHDKRVLIIDKKNHIGGKFYDYVDSNGVLIQKYGFRMIESSDANVISFLENHGTWIRTTDNTKILHDGKFHHHRSVKDTRERPLSEVFTDDTHLDYFSKYYVQSDLYDVFCSDYDRIKCIPSKPYTFQCLPLKGYTAFFQKLLDHDNISVKLETDYFDPEFKEKVSKTFYCGRIDKYYRNRGLPELEYLTTYFEFETVKKNRAQRYPVIDYADKDTLYTRSVEFGYLLGRGSDTTVVSREYNTFYKEDDDICIPLRTTRNRAIFNRYLKLNEYDSKVHLLGSTANFNRYRPETSIKMTFELFDSVGMGRQMTKTRATQIVNDAYQRILLRTPDAGGLETYTAFLMERTEKKGKEELEYILRDSDEYIDKMEMMKELENQRSNPIDDPDLEKIPKQKFVMVDVNFEEISKWAYANYNTIKKNVVFKHEEMPTTPEDLFSVLHNFCDYLRTDQWTYVSKEKLLGKSRKHYRSNACPDFTAGLTSVPPLVVSRYSEDITWTELIDDVTIYNKGSTEKLDTKHVVKQLENIGREGETYLHHIIDNYDNLHDYTIFCQGFPFEHSPRFIDSILNGYKEYSEYQSLTWRWKDVDESISWLTCKNKSGIPPMECRDLTTCFYIDDCPVHYELLDQNFNCVYPLRWTDGGFNECLIPRVIERENLGNETTVLQHVYKRLNIKKDPPPCIPFNYSANFGVSKERILRHSKEFYENVRSFLLEHPDNGYLLERLWMHFFTGF